MSHVQRQAGQVVFGAYITLGKSGQHAPNWSLIPLAEKLLEVPHELIQTALDLERQENPSASGLTAFSRDNPPLARDLKLPDWTCISRLAYPPPTVPLALLIAPVVQGDPRRYSADWHAAIAEEQRALRERQERERVRFCTK